MKRTLTALALILGVASAAQAATIANGSFEAGTNPGSFTTLNSGDNTSISGWTVGSGSVDYIGNYWQASEGVRSVDLTGVEKGSIFTTITDLIVGTAYKVYFDLSGNLDGKPANKKLDVTLANPLTTENYNYNVVTKGNTHANMKWVTYVLEFVATSSSSVLTFAAGNGGGNGNACCYGPALDNVRIASVAAVPVPAGGVLLLTGLAGIAMLRRRSAI